MIWLQPFNICLVWRPNRTCKGILSFNLLLLPPPYRNSSPYFLNKQMFNRPRQGHKESFLGDKSNGHKCWKTYLFLANNQSRENIGKTIFLSCKCPSPHGFAVVVVSRSLVWNQCVVAAYHLLTRHQILPLAVTTIVRKFLPLRTTLISIMLSSRNSIPNGMESNEMKWKMLWSA